MVPWAEAPGLAGRRNLWHGRGAPPPPPQEPEVERGGAGMWPKHLKLWLWLDLDRESEENLCLDFAWKANQTHTRNVSLISSNESYDKGLPAKVNKVFHVLFPDITDHLIFFFQTRNCSPGSHARWGPTGPAGPAHPVRTSAK